MLDVLNRRISRRTFFKASAAVGGAVAGSQLLFNTVAQAATYGEEAPDATTGANVKYLRTMCMMCNSACGQQVKVIDGVAVKCTGNPYHPHNNDVFTGLPGSGDIVPDNVTAAQRYSGARACAKGQAAIMTLYSPYRLTRVLKRNGKRGQGRWSVITWEEAINSICYGYVDAGTSTRATLRKANGHGVDYIRDSGATLAQIADPNQSGNTLPTLGTAMPSGDVDPEVLAAGHSGGLAANRLVIYRGRSQWGPWHDHGDILKLGIGTRNSLGHEAMCNSSFKRAGAEQTAGEGWKPCVGAGTSGPNYVMLFGADYNEACPPHVPIARHLADFRRRSGTTLVTTDIRVSQTAAKADHRLIPKSGTDGVVATAIIRGWFDNGTIATGYLSRPTDALLQAYDNRPSGACMKPDAGSLIYVDGPDVGKRVGGASLSAAYFVEGGSVVVGSAITSAVDLEPGGISQAGSGVSPAYVIPASGTVASGAIPSGTGNACTAYELFKEYAMSKTVAEWSTIAGVSASEISTIATDSAASGARLAVDYARGLSAHSNALFEARAVNALNILQDRLNRIDGTAKSANNGGYVGFSDGWVGGPSPGGTQFDRSGVAYTSGDPAGVTAKRQWFPWANKHAFTEIWASAAEGYPHKVKCLIALGSNAPGYTMSYGGDAPGGAIDQLTSVDAYGDYNIPLLVDIKTCMDETAARSDFVLPEVTYLERWATKYDNGYGGIICKITGIRRPMVGTYVDVTIDGDSARMYMSPFATTTAPSTCTEEQWLQGYEGPMSMEDMQIRIGKKLGLGGVGASGINGTYGVADAHSAKQYYDYQWRLLSGTSGIANDGDNGVPETFDDADGAASGATISNDALYMGGIFSDPSDVGTTGASSGWCSQVAKHDSAYLIPKDDVKSQHLRDFLLNGTKTSFDGSEFATIKPLLLPTHYPAAIGLDLAEVSDSGYDLTWSTYKAAWHTQSRTSENKWLLPLTGRDQTRARTEARDRRGRPTVWISPTTAAAKGLSNGNRVRITSKNNMFGQIARIYVTKTVADDQLVCDHHYGRRWFGSGRPDHRYKRGTAGYTDEATVGKARPDRRMAKGASHTAVARSAQRAGADYNTCLTDPISGQVGYMSPKVKITKL